MAAAIATVELFILVLIAVAFSTRFFAGEVNRAAESVLPQAPAAVQLGRRAEHFCFRDEEERSVEARQADAAPW